MSNPANTLSCFGAGTSPLTRPAQAAIAYLLAAPAPGRRWLRPRRQSRRAPEAPQRHGSAPPRTSALERRAYLAGGRVFLVEVIDVALIPAVLALRRRGPVCVAFLVVLLPGSMPIASKSFLLNQLLLLEKVFVPYTALNLACRSRCEHFLDHLGSVGDRFRLKVFQYCLPALLRVQTVTQQMVLPVVPGPRLHFFNFPLDLSASRACSSVWITAKEGLGVDPVRATTSS